MCAEKTETALVGENGALDYESAAAEVRNWDHKVTPYRIGIAMGRAHKKTFEAWRDEAKRTHCYDNRPDAPKCPYTVNVSVRSWEHGYKMATR
jgi:hypothetical protein